MEQAGAMYNDKANRRILMPQHAFLWRRAALVQTQWGVCGVNGGDDLSSHRHTPAGYAAMCMLLTGLVSHWDDVRA